MRLHCSTLFAQAVKEHNRRGVFEATTPDDTIRQIAEVFMAVVEGKRWEDDGRCSALAMIRSPYPEDCA